MNWQVTAGLERLVDCGRSSKYGFRRHAVLHLKDYPQGCARALRLQGRRREALAAFKAEGPTAAALAGRWELAGGDGIDRAIALEPRNPWWRAWRAIGLLNSCPRSSYELVPRGISRRARKADARTAARAALVDARAAIARDKNCALAHVAAALACEDLADGKSALKHLDRAAALEPREGWILQFRSDVRRRAGDLKGFLADCEAALLLDEGPAYFRFAAGEERSTSRVRVLKAADRYLEAHPDAYWMYAFRGDCRRSPEVNDFSGAADDFKKAVELRPDRAWAWAYRSRSVMGDPEGRAALEAVSRAITLRPDCGWFHVWRGEIRRRRGDAAGALADLERGLELDPDYEMGYAWRGGALRMLGRDGEALKDLELAAALEPNHPWILNERSLALRGLGRTAQALEALAQAARHDPKLSWCPRPEDFERSVEELNRVLRDDPRNFWAYAWRGEARLRMGDFKSAKLDLDRALALKPGHAWALSWRGKVLWSLGRRRDALKDLDRAVRLDPTYSNAWAWRGRLRHELATARSRPSRAGS